MEYLRYPHLFGVIWTTEVLIDNFAKKNYPLLKLSSDLTVQLRYTIIEDPLLFCSHLELTI